MTELTFKIFPVAPEFATLQLHFDTLSDVLSALFFINQSVFELDALDIEPNGDRWTMLIRLNGHGDTLPARCERFITTIKGQTACVDVTQSMNDPIVWDAINNLSWAKDAKHVVKVVVAPKQIPALDQDIQSSASQRRYSVGGNVAWIATDDLSTLSSILETHQLTGLPIFGIANSTTIGKPKDNVLSDRVKQIFDPENKFN